MKNKSKIEIDGIIKDVNNNEITIEVDGVKEVYINEFFNLKVGDNVKFQTKFINVLEKVVIYD
jgi:hypothetical protein